MKYRDTEPPTTTADYDPVTGRYYAQYGPENGISPSRCVIETVAAAVGIDPLQLRPLYEAVDPDALDRLLEPRAGSLRRSTVGALSFRFEGCDVTVNGDGTTVVSPVDAVRR